MSDYKNLRGQNVEAVVDDDGELMIDQNLDAFGRLRVSMPISQFEYNNEYNKGPLIWAEKATGTGSATHQPNSSTVLLTTGGTAEGAGIVRQTVQYMRYAPGKSLLPIITFNFKATGPYIKRAGYFDTENGIFLELDGTTLNLVLRSKSSGAVVETRVPQSAWNCKKLDGSMAGDPVLDITKAQILLIDIQWLGVGTVRVGFEIDGKMYLVHKFNNANIVSTTYMSTANLPIRYEVHNKAGAAVAGTIEQICATVMTEQGSIDDQGYYEHSVNNGVAGKSVASRLAIMTIRPKATFGGKANRGTIKHETFEIVAGTNNVFWELIYGGTIGGSPSFASAGDNSLVETATNGTTVTGGEVVASGYSLTGGGAAKGIIRASTQARYPLGLDVDGANPTTLTLVCTPLTGTAVVNASLGFKEYY